MSALDGIRVLDFGRFVAGPYCATMLAEFGAEVIRIEPPGGGEDRGLCPVTAAGEGALFLQIGRNKQSLTLDLTSEAGREIAHQLVATADIVVTNMARSALPQSGLDYETLAAIKADIIHVNCSAYGDVGPWADRPGFDSVGQAMSGAVWLSGTPDQPYRAQVNWVDYGTAVHAALGAVLALQERTRSGRGQEVGTSLLGTAISFQNGILIDQMMLESNRQGLGNRGFASGPTDIFKVADGWIVVHVVSNPIFRRWARLVGEEAWVGDPRFATDKLRGDHGALLSERTASWCAARTREQALAELGAAKVPAAPVLSAQEAIDHPQVEALGVLEQINCPDSAATTRVARVPIELSGTPGQIHSGPPAAGAHTDAILRGLGLDDARIATLRAGGII